MAHVFVEFGITCLEHNWHYSCKIEGGFTYDSQILILDIYPGEFFTGMQAVLYIECA